MLRALCFCAGVCFTLDLVFVRLCWDFAMLRMTNGQLYGCG